MAPAKECKNRWYLPYPYSLSTKLPVTELWWIEIACGTIIIFHANTDLNKADIA